MVWALFAIGSFTAVTIVVDYNPFRHASRGTKRRISMCPAGLRRLD
jgi:hypothetical protein